MEHLLGTPMIYSILSFIDENIADFFQNCLSSDLHDKQESENMEKEEALTEEEELELVRKSQEEARLLVNNISHEDKVNVSARTASKQFIVGLVAKPSTGKSTFFNCVTRMNEKTLAKVGAFPFTTIEPNLGQGFWTCFDPVDSKNKKGKTEFGRDENGQRLLPVIVKDVAGLVPGAYKGLGKGNKFLNDLADADVLLHIIDVSGMSSEQGVISNEDLEVDPIENVLRDVKWIEEELHQWVYGNVFSKWSSVLKAGKSSSEAALERLNELLTGYQKNTKVLVSKTLTLCQYDSNLICSWTAREVHKFIAVFLALRFPICLVLNKFDKLFLKYSEKDLILIIQELKVKISALGYSYAFSSALLDSTQFETVLSKDSEILIEKISTFSRSIDLKISVSNAISLGRDEERFLCLQMRQGSTVEMIYSKLISLGKKESGLIKFDGDFVRAEVSSKQKVAFKQVGRDFILTKDLCLVKVYTNKKTQWQHLLK
eukprot:maker-scaffold_47-snap-gene-1.7-mRNA-1 protein AED:0.27 eAED:0.27 QI:0/0/0/0.66/1/1/3/0/486